MKIYKSKATEFTPEIEFDFVKHRLSLTGVCAPENPVNFFDMLNGYIEEYKKDNKVLSIDIRFDYFNTGTSKCLLNLLKDLKHSGSQLDAEVNWYSDKGDDEMKENGEIFEELSKLKFNYLEYEE